MYVMLGGLYALYLWAARFTYQAYREYASTR